MTNTLVIDEGTSSTRAAVYAADFSRTEFSQLPVPLISPSPDIVEQDANLIWAQTLAVAKAALNGKMADAIAITNQRETTIIWDRATGIPVYNALVWQDRRGADLGAQMKIDGREKLFNAKTGLLADPYFSAFKLAWLLDNVPNLRARAQNGELAFGNVDSWLIWNLTNGKTHATDASNASRTGLFNIFNADWDDELLAMFNIPKSLLPDVRDSDGDFGICNLFGGEIPIRGVLGDQQAALMGQNCVKSGQAKITFGTGAFLMVQLEGEPKQSTNKMLLTIASKLGGKINYAIEGAVLNAGTAIQWLRDEMGLIEHAAQSEELANSLSDNGGVYLVPAFTGLGAPYWNAGARALICGIGRGTKKAHIVRAALEASAYQTYDLIKAIEKDGVNIKILRIDGGMVANNFFCQFLCDICNVIVERPMDTEMTAMGAARVGRHAKFEEAAITQFIPKMAKTLREKNIAGWISAINATLSAAS